VSVRAGEPPGTSVLKILVLEGRFSFSRLDSTGRVVIDTGCKHDSGAGETTGGRMEIGPEYKRPTKSSPSGSDRT
jgi:hypothetical protein